MALKGLNVIAIVKKIELSQKLLERAKVRPPHLENWYPHKKVEYKVGSVLFLQSNVF